MPEWWWESTAWTGEAFTTVRRTTGAGELVEHLRSLGEDGYVELARSADAYPVLALGLGMGVGVVHRSERDAAWLLRGDGSVPAGVSMDVQVQDELEPFAGELLMTRATAVALVQRFVEGAHVDELGSWGPV